MKVFKLSSDNPGKTGKFVGFYIDKDVDEMLTLLSIGKGESKSSMLRKYIVSFISEENPISLVAKKAFIKWRDGSHISLTKFCGDIMDDLERKGIQDGTIKKIIEEFSLLLNKG